MKNVKLVIALFTVTAFIFSCNPKEKKPDTVKVEKKEMSFEQVVKELGFNPYDSSTNAAAKGKPYKPPKAVIIVWFNDLTLAPIAGGYTTTLPSNAKWSGVQNLTLMTSLCNWYLQTGVMNCVTSSTGQIRSWCSDTDDNIHISNVISN